MRLILIILLLPSICFSADKWSREDIILESTFQIINYIDYRQTHYIADSKKFKEANPFIGSTPKDHDINLAFGLIGVGHALITNYLPASERKRWHYALILFKCLVVNRNHNIGVQFSF